MNFSPSYKISPPLKLRTHSVLMYHSTVWAVYFFFLVSPAGQSVHPSSPPSVTFWGLLNILPIAHPKSNATKKSNKKWRQMVPPLLTLLAYSNIYWKYSAWTLEVLIISLKIQKGWAKKCSQPVRKNSSSLLSLSYYGPDLALPP